MQAYEFMMQGIFWCIIDPKKDWDLLPAWGIVCSECISCIVSNIVCTRYHIQVKAIVSRPGRYKPPSIQLRVVVVCNHNGKKNCSSIFLGNHCECLQWSSRLRYCKMWFQMSGKHNRICGRKRSQIIFVVNIQGVFVIDFFFKWVWEQGWLMTLDALNTLRRSANIYITDFIFDFQTI